MKLIDQSIMHDPENGKWGNCQSACIATLLGVAIEEVPHKNKEITGEQQDKMFNEYLAQYGLMLMRINLDPDFYNWNQQYVGVGDVYHLIFGKSERGTYHSVVGKNGEVFHDPHPSKAGLLPPSDDNEWQTVFLIRIDNKRTSAGGSE